MSTTKSWAESRGIPGDTILPAIEGYTEPYARTAEQVAIRTIILHGVCAVAFGVDADAVVEWFKEQNLWTSISPNEDKFFSNPQRTEQQLMQFQWRSESEWALLWTIKKVDSLGLPIRVCDTAQLVDEIMPALGESISEFISSATLRPPSELLAEDDRIYNLHCYARIDRKNGVLFPDDLIYGVLYERHYAFEWLSDSAEWDDVTCDT